MKSIDIVKLKPQPLLYHKKPVYEGHWVVWDQMLAERNKRKHVHRQTQEEMLVRLLSKKQKVQAVEVVQQVVSQKKKKFVHSKWSASKPKQMKPPQASPQKFEQIQLMIPQIEKATSRFKCRSMAGYNLLKSKHCQQQKPVRKMSIKQQFLSTRRLYFPQKKSKPELDLEKEQQILLEQALQSRRYVKGEFNFI